MNHLVEWEYIWRHIDTGGFKEIKLASTTLDHIRREGINLAKRAEKWNKVWGGVYDDEMPITPERIAMWLNFANDHFPDYDTEKELEEMIAEYVEWESDLGIAEDKLEAIRKIYDSQWHQNAIGAMTKIGKVLGE